MNEFSKTVGHCMRWLLAMCVWAASLGNAFAFVAGGENTTFEGCRNDGNPVIALPDGSGKFICPDGAYTTGNLGDRWNELDLLPFRLTTTTGSADATDYGIYIAGDGINNGKVGWDVITVPVVNAAKSDASCSVAAVGGQSTLGDNSNPFGGGTDTVIFRELAIHQAKGTTCVFDYVQRLALGAHSYSGSSLQSYIFKQAGLSAGKSTISLPVNEIRPQVLTKDMTATQGSDHAWSVVKSPSAANLGFGDVCRADAPSSLPVTITVSWTKLPAVLGQITVITHVYATNPAARSITTSVIDKIYSGTTLLDTSAAATKDVPANTTNYLMLEHVFTAPAGTTDLNDVATATYVDKVTGIPIPGATTATAAAPVQNTGPELNAIAAIADLEIMTGAGLTFAVATPTVGAFQPYPTATDPAYSAGTPTVGPVAWAVTGQTDSGSVSFNKMVFLSGKTITSGTLSDVANLAASNGFTTNSNPVSIGISSSATVKLTLSKTIPLTLGAGESVQVTFHVAGSNTGYASDQTLTFDSTHQSSQALTLSGLAPDQYTVTEISSLYFYPGGPVAGVASGLAPVGGNQKVVDLSVANGVVSSCSGSAAFVNLVSNGTPSAQVQKITVPVTNSADPWKFTLSGPGLPGGLLASVNANTGYLGFGIPLTNLGTYTVTETQQTPAWVLTSASPDPTATKVCTFTITNLDILNGSLKSCTFTNTKQGGAKVVKTVKGVAPSGTQAFTFQLRQGATTSATGTLLEAKDANAANGGAVNFATYLVPGATYQVCEIVMPGWLTSLGTFVPGSFMPPDGVATNPAVDNSIQCGNFTVAAGETKTFTVDNSPPPGGKSLTIGFWKNWASCTKSALKSSNTLDLTMAKAEPLGIQVDSFYLHGSTVAPKVAPDCAKAVSLLSKQTYGGVNKSSDPLFNMTAQLVAAELNLAAGAYSCPLVVSAIGSANALLTKYSFNGTTHTALTAADSTLANSLAKRLDDYNNDRPAACTP